MASFDFKRFFSNSKNVALAVVAFAVLAIGIYLLYLQLNPVVTAVIESEAEVKITVQVVSCDNTSITRAPFTEKRIDPGTTVLTVRPTGAPKLIRILRQGSSVGEPPFVGLKELTLSQITKTDLLKGANVVAMPYIVTDKVQPQTLAAEVLPIPIKAVHITEIHVNESIHRC